MPHLHPFADTSGYGGFLSAAGDVQVQWRIPFLIREERACACDLMHIVKEMFHGRDRLGAAMLRAHNQRAPLVSTAEDD